MPGGHDMARQGSFLQSDVPLNILNCCRRNWFAAEASNSILMLSFPPPPPSEVAEAVIHDG